MLIRNQLGGFISLWKVFILLLIRTSGYHVFPTITPSQRSLRSTSSADGSQYYPSITRLDVSSSSENFDCSAATDIILRQQLQLAVMSTKSIYGEIYLFEPSTIDQEMTNLFSLHSFTTNPSIELQEEIIQALLGAVIEQESPYFYENHFAVPLRDGEHCFGCLYLMRARRKTETSPSTEEKTNENTKSTKRIWMSRMVQLIDLTAQTIAQALALDQTYSQYIRATNAMTSYKDGYLVTVNPSAIQSTKINAKFLRAILKQLSQRLPKGDEMGHELVENGEIQLEAIEENMEQAAYMIPVPSTADPQQRLPTRSYTTNSLSTIIPALETEEEDREEEMEVEVEEGSSSSSSSSATTPSSSLRLGKARTSVK